MPRFLDKKFEMYLEGMLLKVCPEIEIEIRDTLQKFFWAGGISVIEALHNAKLKGEEDLFLSQLGQETDEFLIEFMDKKIQSNHVTIN